MRNILENLGRLFIIIIIIAFAINLTSCSKDAIDEMDIPPPTVVEPTPDPTPEPTVTVTSVSETVTSTEEIEDVDVNEDGDLLDAIQRLITVTTTTTDTQSNAVTTEGAWEVTLDVNAEATTGTSTETTTEDAIDIDVNQDGDLLDVLIRTITTVATVTGDVTETSSSTTEWTIHEDRTDPMDTAEFTAWSSWTPAQGDGSAPTFTQTRSRECVVTVNGLEDSEAPVCDGDAIQTRNVADSNYVEPSNDFTDEQIASFQATLVSAGYHQWAGDSSGLTYRINEQPHFGNLYIKIRTEDFSLYAWVNSESGIVTVGTAQTVEEAISTMNNFYENGNTAPDEYIINKSVPTVNGNTNYVLITNTGAEYCVNYDYWTNVQYTSGGTYSFTEVDHSQVVDCYTEADDHPYQWHYDLVDLGWIRGSGNWNTGTGFYHANPNHSGWTVSTNDAGQSFTVSYSAFGYSTTVNSIDDIATTINNYVQPHEPIVITYTVGELTPVDADDPNSKNYRRVEISVSNPSKRVFSIRTKAGLSCANQNGGAAYVFSIGGGEYTDYREFGLGVTPNYGSEFDDVYNWLAIAHNGYTFYNFSFDDGTTLCVGGGQSQSYTIN